jgi:hypothetical protein
MRNTRFVACATLLAGAFLSLKIAQDPPVEAQDAGPDGLSACYDVDRNGRIDLTDPLILLDWLFKGGTEPGDCLAKEGEGGGEPARQMAGVFLMKVIAGADPPFLQLISGHADGTHASTKTKDFGGGDLETNGFESPEHGAWEPLGEDKITTTSLTFHYDSNGAQTLSIRVRSTITFRKLDHGKFQEIAGDFSADFFNPDKNPVMDAPTTVNGLQGTFEGQRLNIVPRALTSCYDVDRNGGIDLTDPVLLLQWLFQGGPEPTLCPAQDGGGRDQVAKNIAGVYFRPVTGGSPEFQDLITLYEDGSLTATTTLDFGHGGLEQNGFRSPEHGVWEVLGNGEIATTSLIFKYTSNGRLEGVHRNRSTIRFSDLKEGKFQEAAGDVSVDVFGPDQDTITEAPRDADLIQRSFTGKRLDVQ